MVQVDTGKCVGCGTCVADCQPFAIRVVDGKCQPNPDARCITCGHCEAICPQNAIHVVEYEGTSDILPYEPASFDIEPDRLLNFIRFRRSVRQFEKKQVPDEMIEKIIEAGRYTESGANRQTARFVVLAGDTMEKVKDIANRTLAEVDIDAVDFDKIDLPPLYQKFQAVWVKWNEIYRKTGVEMLLHDAPHHLLIIVDKGNVVDAMLKAESMELMIHALGLGACCTGFGTLAYAISPQLQEIIGLKEGESVGFSMTFGWPKVKYQRTTNRRPADYQKI